MKYRSKYTMKTSVWQALVCASVCVASPVATHAQNASARPLPGTGTQIEEQFKAPGPATSVPLSDQPGGRPTSTSPKTELNVVGRTLQDWAAHGYAVRLGYIQNIAGNPSGGLSQGITSAQEVDASLDLDLGKIAGWQGTRVHIQGATFWGKSDGRDYIGNSISLQSTWRPVPGPRLTLLTLDQDLLDGRVNVVVGRAPVNSYFASSPVNCAFQSNATCLALYGPIIDVGISAFPNSSWAGKLQYNFSKNIYLQGGAFEFDPYISSAKHYYGLNFSTAHATGYILPAELGYQTSFEDDAYPRRYKVGGYYNSGPATDPYLDRLGRSSVVDRLPRVTYDGRAGIFLLADQTIYRPDPASRDNLLAFGRVFTNAGRPTTVDWFAQAGLLQTGTFGNRHDDTIGFSVSDAHFSSRQIDYLSDIRRRNGGTGRPASNEILFELNYGMQVARGLRLVPNVQYVINPDPINAPQARANIPDALVLGLKLVVSLGDLVSTIGH